jgi:rhodanese-related sulfurtransferase
MALALAPEHPLLQQAREQARARQLAYGGEVTPAQAWDLLSERAAVLVDVRTAEERKFVGYVAGSVHVPWQLGTAMQTNPRFVRELESKLAKDTPILMLCRSGARSAAAALAATHAGFKHVFTVIEGFEGDLDENRQRGRRGGWRYRALPWIQD